MNYCKANNLKTTSLVIKYVCQASHRSLHDPQLAFKQLPSFSLKSSTSSSGPELELLWGVCLSYDFTIEVGMCSSQSANRIE